MLDLISLSLILAFFAGSLSLVALCQRLMEE